VGGRQHGRQLSTSLRNSIDDDSVFEGHFSSTLADPILGKAYIESNPTLSSVHAIMSHLKYQHRLLRFFR
jgi:hypothetical protein